jgi:serine phosphatase RsbU (regulator of sigma subunit)/pSer/pThr/pTyr-binding forkhead associated (FHA) protein
MGSSLYVEVPGELPFEVRLDKDAVSVGRSEDNVLGLRDMNVSRHHFSIERQSNGWWLRDRGSRNGTLVNRKVVTEKLLIDGDKIEVGGSSLVFRAQASRNSITTEAAPKPQTGREAPPLSAPGEPAGPSPTSRGKGTPGPSPRGGVAIGAKELPPPLTGDDGPGRRFGGTTPHGLPALAPKSSDAPAAELPVLGADTKRRQDPWRKLAELTGAINQERDVQRLLERIVDAVLSLVPARGAFLVTVERGTGELAMKVARNLEMPALKDSSGALLSMQVCKRAIAEKKPVLTHNAVGDAELGEFATVANLQLKALLCVPFGVAGEVLGVVYLDEPQFEAGARDAVDLVAAFGDLAGITFANARHLEEVKERERLSENLKLAQKIQRKLLPESAPELDGLEVAGRTIPAEEIGGDIYDFFGDPNEFYYISIGDVSGKGVGAGIVMASVHALLRAYAEYEPRTDKILVAVNRALARDLERGSFVSLLLLRYSRRHRAVAYASAGHEHMILLRARTGATETVRSGGVVLGLTPNNEGKVEEKVIDLAPGDVVVFYTDGATEAASPTGEEFGLERVEAAVREARGKHPKDVVEHVVRRVQEFQGAGRVPRDDLTVVAIRKT